MTHHQHSVKDFFLLLVLSLCWGSSFLFLKIALVDFGALSMASTRLTISALLMILVVLFKGYRIPFRGPALKHMTIAAFLGFALPFTMVGWGQQHIDSGTGAILMAFTPITTAIIAHYKTDTEKLTKVKLLGIIIALIGVFVLLGGGTMKGGMLETFSQLAILFAATCYAIASLYIKKLNYLPAIVSSTGIMIISALMLLPLALVFDPVWERDISQSSILSILYLSLIASGFAIFLMTYLINTAGMTFMAYNNFLVPAVGVLWGIVFLGELANFYTFTALGFILVGIAIATLFKSNKRKIAN